jgi:hypothetical protein
MVNLPPSRFANWGKTPHQSPQDQSATAANRPHRNQQHRKKQAHQPPPLPSRFACRYTPAQLATAKPVQHRTKPDHQSPRRKPLQQHGSQSLLTPRRRRRHRRPKLQAIITTTGPCFTKPWEKYRYQMTQFKLHFTKPPRFLPPLESILEHPPQPREEALRMAQVLRWKFGYVLCQMFEYFERKHTPPVAPTNLTASTTNTEAAPTHTDTIPPRMMAPSILDVPICNPVLDPFLCLYYFHKLRPPDILEIGLPLISFYRAYFFCRVRPPEWIKV